MEGESGSGGLAKRIRQPSAKAVDNEAAAAVVSSRKKRSHTGNRGADGTAAAGRSKGRPRGSKKKVSPPPESPDDSDNEASALSMMLGDTEKGGSDAGDGTRYTLDVRVGYVLPNRLGQYPKHPTFSPNNFAVIKSAITDDPVISFDLLVAQIRGAFRKHKERGIGGTKEYVIATDLMKGPFSARSKALPDGKGIDHKTPMMPIENDESLRVAVEEGGLWKEVEPDRVDDDDDDDEDGDEAAEEYHITIDVLVYLAKEAAEDGDASDGDEEGPSSKKKKRKKRGSAGGATARKKKGRPTKEVDKSLPTHANIAIRAPTVKKITNNMTSYEAPTAVLFTIENYKLPIKLESQAVGSPAYPSLPPVEVYDAELSAVRFDIISKIMQAAETKNVYGESTKTIGDRSTLMYCDQQQKRMMKPLHSNLGLNKLLTEQAADSKRVVEEVLVDGDTDSDGEDGGDNAGSLTRRTLVLVFSIGQRANDDTSAKLQDYSDPYNRPSQGSTPPSYSSPAATTKASDARAEMQNAPAILATFMMMLYNDEESPLHHGFGLQHQKVLLAHFKLPMNISQIPKTVDGLDAPFMIKIDSIVTNRIIANDCHGREMEKGKFPPEDPEDPKPPVIKRGENGGDSGDGGGSSSAMASAIIQMASAVQGLGGGGAGVGTNGAACNIHVSFRRYVNGGVATDSFPVPAVEATEMTLHSLCEKVDADSGVWDRAREWGEIFLVVLRDGFDQKSSQTEGGGGGGGKCLDVPFGRLSQYKLGDLVSDGIVSLSAGSKVCLEVEYRKKVATGSCKFGSSIGGT